MNFRAQDPPALRGRSSPKRGKARELKRPAPVSGRDRGNWPLPRIRTLHNARKPLFPSEPKFEQRITVRHIPQFVSGVRVRWKQFRIGYFAHLRVHFRKVFFAVAVML